MRRTNDLHYVPGHKGIELYSIDMTALLRIDKLIELQSIIRDWTGKKFCTRKEVESLVGKLTTHVLLSLQDVPFYNV